MDRDSKLVEVRSGLRRRLIEEPRAELLRLSERLAKRRGGSGRILRRKQQGAGSRVSTERNKSVLARQCRNQTGTNRDARQLLDRDDLLG